jgi:hypothetical protein
LKVDKLISSEAPERALYLSTGRSPLYSNKIIKNNKIIMYEELIDKKKKLAVIGLGYVG